MKLIDVLDLIPTDAGVSVELYDDDGEMFYAYLFDPNEDRSILKREYEREVIGLHAGMVSSVRYTEEYPVISIEIRANI